jgi:hypothetical protein
MAFLGYLGEISIEFLLIFRNFFFFWILWVGSREEEVYREN